MVKKVKIDNPDIIPIALYELGGTGEFIDVEDIFLRCYKLTPERFKWRKHKLPNYKILSKALRDFEGKNPQFLIKTQDGLSRQLSAEGLKWLRVRLPIWRKILQIPGANPPTRRSDQRLLNELRDHPIVANYIKGVKLPLEKFQVADLLMCSPDSPSSVWYERLETFRSAAAGANRKDLLGFLNFLALNKPEWFELTGDKND